MSKKYVKGRGAQKKLDNQFLELKHEVLDEFLNFCEKEAEVVDSNKTKYLDVFPKTIVNKVQSPDVGMNYSANPYQGCEHGCVYCYARNSHQYWGYGPGLDFERIILVKKNAAALLDRQLSAKKWEPRTIVFSGNTDCYQPIERKLKITRKSLEVMLKWKHPTGIITKNSLILRDLDLLSEMARLNTIKVVISVTSLTEDTRRLLEPRTASIKQRLKTIEQLAEKNIPVTVMIAPIIPSLNSHEIIPLVKAVANAGAKEVSHTIVRLNGQIGALFTDWAEQAIPDKASRILNQIAECHGGRINDSQFGRRMRGSGSIADQINQTMKLARKKYLGNYKHPPLETSHYWQLKNPQMRLFH